MSVGTNIETVHVTVDFFCVGVSSAMIEAAAFSMGTARGWFLIVLLSCFEGVGVVINIGNELFWAPGQPSFDDASVDLLVKELFIKLVWVALGGVAFGNESGSKH